MSSIGRKSPFITRRVLGKAAVDDKPISQHGKFTLKMLLNSWDHKTTNSAHIELHISCRVHKFKSLWCCRLALVAAAYTFNRLLCEVWVDYLPFNIREHKFSTFHRRKEKFVVFVCLFYPKRIQARAFEYRIASSGWRKRSGRAFVCDARCFNIQFSLKFRYSIQFSKTIFAGKKIES